MGSLQMKVKTIDNQEFLSIGDVALMKEKYKMYKSANDVKSIIIVQYTECPECHNWYWKDVTEQFKGE